MDTHFGFELVRLARGALTLPVEEAYPLLKPDTNRFEEETWFDNSLGRLGMGVGD